MKSWLSQKVEVKHLPSGEKGLFARSAIASGEQLTRVGDDIVKTMTAAEFSEFAQTHDYKDALKVTGGFKKVTIGSPNDYSVLATASDNPNAYNDGDGLIAIRAIAAGDQISI